MNSGAAHTIHLVSDGTCRTCEQVVRAVLVQFGPIDVQLVRHPNVRRPQTVAAVVREAAANHALIFYTLVYDKARAAMEAETRERQVMAVDLLGPVLVSLYDLFRRTPRARPGILYRSNKAHYDRIDAVEYTLGHDDGCRLHELDQADVVLVGVSRASKSTTCFYLAYGGVRAANVPLFADQPPPVELTRLDPRRVIGLTLNPERLQAVRQARLRGWGADLDAEYADRLHLARELRAAHEQMNQHGWRCIDVSYKAIEEIAREVKQLLAETVPDDGRR